MQQQKQRVEVEGKREDQSRKQHQVMMKVLVEQTKQQQEQMLSFQQLFTLMQQQKSQIIMKLQEKRKIGLVLHADVHNIFNFVVNTCFNI